MRECHPVFVGREKAQFGTNSTGPLLLVPLLLVPILLAPLLLDQFYWTNSTDSVSSTGPILLAYDFFLNF